MILIIVSVKDRALGVFGRPFFVHTAGQAIRSFQDEINRQDANNEMNRHPDDYDLWYIGSWDDDKGQFYPHGPETPRQIAIGKQMKIQQD